MDYIASVQVLPNRKLAKKIQEKFNVKVSHVTVGKYKKSLLETPTLTKITKNITKNSSAVPRRKRFDFSIDTLKRLLDANPNHILHDEIEHQYIGNVVINNGKQKKTGGKLRSDLIKLCTFVRDVT